jgi:hypothetical protein
LVPKAAPRAVLHNPKASSQYYSQKYSGNKFPKIIIKNYYPKFLVNTYPKIIVFRNKYKKNVQNYFLKYSWTIIITTKLRLFKFICKIISESYSPKIIFFKIINSQNCSGKLAKVVP